MGFFDPAREEALYSPNKLTCICVNNIIKRVLCPVTPPVSAESLESKCKWEINYQVCKHLLSSLPFNLTSSILEQAHKLLDNHHDVEKLLFILLCTLENSKTRTLRTPVYLYSRKDARKRLLEMVLESNLVELFTEAQFNMYNFYYRPDMSQSWTDDGEVEFEMLRLSLYSDESLLVADVLERSINLSSLCLHTVCTNQFINIISKRCVNLNKLDISFSKNVNDDGMATLATSVPLQSSLRMLQVENTLVTQAGIFMVLEHLRNLVFLDSSAMEDYLYCMQNFFSKSSVLDAALVSNSGGHFGIKKLFLSLNKYHADKLSIFYVITLLFPNLVELKLQTLHRSEQQHLDCIVHLRQLRSLMVGSTPLQALLPTFAKIGGNLTTFCCSNYTQDGAINFSVVSEFCSNLRILSMSGNSLVHDDISTAALQQLRTVMINVHAYIPVRIWTHLVQNCHELRQLDFTSCEDLTDTALAVLLVNPPALANLEKFHVKGTHSQDVLLTDISVKLLKDRCKEIRCIGDCFTWTLKPKQYSVNQIRGLM